MVAVVVSVWVVVSANDTDEAEGEGATEGVGGGHEHDACDANDITKFAGLISRCTMECECTNSIREICGNNWSSVRGSRKANSTHQLIR